MEIKDISDICQGFLTPIIAIIALYIAYQQWRTNEAKLQLDLYERRLKIYEEVTCIIAIVMQKADVSYEELSRFARSVSEADFLFESEIKTYIDEIYKRGVKLSSLNKQYNHFVTTNITPANYDHQSVCDGMNQENLWFIEQFEQARQKFSRYLKIKPASLSPPK